MKNLNVFIHCKKARSHKKINYIFNLIFQLIRTVILDLESLRYFLLVVCINDLYLFTLKLDGTTKRSLLRYIRY